MRLSSYLTLAILLAGVGAGCTSRRNVDLERDSFVGEYIYRVDDKGSPHDPDKLTLRADGKYVLMHMSGGHPGSIEEGEWRLENEPTPNILLGHAGFPVEIKGGGVRLLINSDLGWSYEKTK